MRQMWRRTALGVFVAVPVLVFIFFRTDGTETIEALGDANYALIPPAVTLLIAAIWLQAVRWRYLLRPLVDVSPARLYPLVFIGHLGNSVLPLRAGDVLRAFVLRRREGISRAATLGTLAVEHILDGVMLVGLLLIFIAAANAGEGLWELALVSGIIFGGASGALIAAAVWQEGSMRVAEVGISRLPDHWRDDGRRWISSFLAGTRALRSVEVAVIVFATTICFWLMVSAVYLIVGEAFHIDEGVDTYLLVTAAANLAFSVPLTQGGLGSFEFLVRQTLIFAEVDAAVATAYALALHALIIGSMVCAGLISLWMVGLSVREISDEVTAGEEEEPEAKASARR